ncbi:hypothetical protein GCM10010400_09890 [Streptomyces aculeolatus]|uniref:hypothetical protein n=1 Tax=Streptomyces aculeolatus TaxID=270689 RepID=UPI0027E04569|nr:hypothetical protein [Streptomyces aculeolatus]
MSSLLSAMPGILIITLCYAALCAISPFGSCRRCRGFGFRMRQTRRGRLVRGRDCRPCRGNGRRIRLGRHVYNSLSGMHREGTR